MPIRPENRHRYPPEWPQIRRRILARAGYCCEVCGLFDRAWGWRDGAGEFHQVGKSTLIAAKQRRGGPRVKPPFELRVGRMTVRVIEIVLTIAHLDHRPENCADENLRAMCQRCHLHYDLPHHKTTAYMTRRVFRGTLELPL